MTKKKKQIRKRRCNKRKGIIRKQGRRKEKKK